MSYIIPCLTEWQEVRKPLPAKSLKTTLNLRGKNKQNNTPTSTKERKTLGAESPLRIKPFRAAMTVEIPLDSHLLMRVTSLKLKLMNESPSGRRLVGCEPKGVGMLYVTTLSPKTT